MYAKPFLHDLAVLLKEQFGDKLGGLAIILPNRRGALFLKKHLAEVYRKTIILPEILSVEELLERFTGLKLIDSTDLLFESYETYRTINSEPEKFIEYSKWAPSLLNDFNEIDKSLAPTEQLFAYLNEVKAIELWSPSNNTGEYQLSDFQKNYLAFWNELNEFYNHFTKHLISNKTAYQGLIYRYAIENFDTFKDEVSFDKLIFSGFNAFNNAEEEFIKRLIKAQKVSLVWDADSFYIDDENQEAGRFLRKYFKDELFKKASFVKDGKDVLFIQDNLLHNEKVINVTGVPGNIGQVKYAGGLLDNFSQDDLKNTAIVLADESLLLPMLHSLPPSVESINVTMGYAFSNSVVSDFVNKLLQLFISREKYSNSDSFYYLDVMQLLQHSIWKQYLDTQSSKCIEIFLDRIVNTNRVWIGKKEFTDFLSQTPLLNKLNNLVNGYDAGISVLIHHLGLFFKSLILDDGFKNSKNDELSQEFIWSTIKVFKRIASLQNKFEVIENVDFLKSIFQSVARNATVSFVGEPLSGLQIMGMLETRTLDFENIILLSANEDVLPSGNSGHSFIPFDIKREFKMLTTSDKDAVFAYHFYRLIQRAKNIHILYNSETGGVGSSGEKSRFITQMENELFKRNPSIKFSQQLLHFPIKETNKDPNISINKSADIMKKILDLSAFGLSPTLLNMYRTCSLKFYFHHIAGIREPEEVSETIDAAIFGIVLHEVLEKYYTQIINKPITSEFLNECLKTIEKELLSVLSEQKKGYDISFGKNLLSVKVAVKYIQKLFLLEKYYIENDKENIVIKDLEQNLESKINVNGHEINLKGKVDRIDESNKMLRVIDYKTGAVDEKELNITSVDDFKDQEKNYDKSFQLLMYAYLYHKKFNRDQFRTAVVSFRSLSNGFMYLKINKSSLVTTEIFNEFEKYLNELLSEILNESIPFQKTPQIKSCEYCDFKIICNR